MIDGKNEWVKQKFIGEDLINYEDSNGNYWDSNWGACEYPILVVESTRMLSTRGYTSIDYNSSVESSNDFPQNWGISHPIIKSGKNVIYLGPSSSYSGYSFIGSGNNYTVGTSSSNYTVGTSSSYYATGGSNNNTTIDASNAPIPINSINVSTRFISADINTSSDTALVTREYIENSTIDIEPVLSYNVSGTTNSVSYSTIGGGYSSTIGGGYNNRMGLDDWGSNYSKVKSHYCDNKFYYNGGLTIKEVNDE